VPKLDVVIPSPLATSLSDAATKNGTSVDSVVTAALGQYFRTTRHVAYQISTSAALVQGVFDGVVSSRDLLAHGNFGLGTFQNLDGEMVVLDGIIYQVRGDGSVRERRDDFFVPFAIVSRFQPDESFEISAIASLQELEKACDPQRESENLFYALRVEGFFDRIHTRAVQPPGEGKGLAVAAQTQPEFHFTDIEGSLVSVWSPRYSSAFSVPGYHFHFLSKDRAHGGHVLGCAAKSLRAELQVLSEYDVRLPEAGTFLKENLGLDTTKVLEKTE
jgi:acetolactate decarboxylase